MIRLILAVIYLILYLVLTIPLMLICWIIQKLAPKIGDRMALAIVNWGWRQLIRICGTRVTVLGHEKIPTDTPVLYVGNHRSYFDIVLTYPRVVGPTSYISKKEVDKVPLLNIWMRLLHCLFLDRKNPRSGLDMILNAIELEKKGISIAVFPEGTRNRNHNSSELLPMHNGSFKIATKSGVPIVPVTLVGTEQIFEAHPPFIRSTKVIIEYGDPIDPKTLDKDTLKDLGGYVGKILHDTYVKNKDLLA